MRTVATLSRLTVAAALGLSLAACGSSGGTSAVKSDASSVPGSATGGSAPPGSSAAGGSSTGGSSTDGGPDAKALVHEARAAYRSAKSADLHADVTASDGARQTTDIRGTINGSNQEVRTQQSTTKNDIRIRTVSHKYYLKADESFWTKSTGLPTSESKGLVDRWVIMPDNSTASFKKLTIKNFLDQIIGPKSVSDAKLAEAKTTTTTYHGKPAYVITSARKNTITIDAASKNLLEVNSTQGWSTTGQGTITVSGWDAQPKFGKPAGAQTMAALMK